MAVRKAWPTCAAVPEKVMASPLRAVPWTVKPTRNARSVWAVTTSRYSGAHFATMPEDLVKRCVLAGSRVSDIVLDPFFGAGTTGLVAMRHRRNFIGIELNPEYIKIARARLLKEMMS